MSRDMESITSEEPSKNAAAGVGAQESRGAEPWSLLTSGSSELARCRGALTLKAHLP